MTNRTLRQVFSELSFPDCHATKAAAHYDIYQPYLARMADQPISMLELGVYGGESLKTFARYFHHGRVLGIDIKDRCVDFSGFPNATFALGDQRDRDGLLHICRDHSPDGFDIILDDASHFGTWSLGAYLTLFPLLKPGGFYIVEDWGSGYWDDWPDGGRFQQFPLGDLYGQINRRIPSHDFGMVGFVKYLVDEVASHTRRDAMHAVATGEPRVEYMYIHHSSVVLQKAAF